MLALACSGADPPPAQAPRLISLAPSISRILVAIGAAGTLVGVDAVSAGLPELAGMPVLEVEPADVERALALRPTLALGLAADPPRAFLSELRARGVEVLEIDAVTLDDAMRRYREIGALVGREREAAELVQRASIRMGRISGSNIGRERPRTAWVVGRDPIRVVGGGSALHDLLEIAGAESIFELAPTSYREVSAAELAEAAPELLLDATRAHPDAASEAVARESWRRVLSVPRIEFLAPASAMLPALDVADRVQLLHARIHPGSDP